MGGIILKKLIIFAALIAVGGTGHAKQRTVIDPLPAQIVDNNHVVSVSVSIDDTAQKKMQELEAKAAEKRTSAGLPAFDPAAQSTRPAKEAYATLPFTAMFPLVMQDVTRQWGLVEGKGTPIKLQVTIESVKTANAGMALLLSSSDELSGKVDVQDMQGTGLGSFYVQVVNNHGGLGGLAMRGSGVREKLVEEFSLESARILTGSTKKDWKARLKAKEKAEAQAPQPVASGSSGTEK